MELTQQLIKHRSKQFDLGCIALLDLSHAGLARLANLEECGNVIQLNLAHNKVLISDLEGLPVLLSLLSLDLSDNCLDSINDLPRFPALEELVLTDNQIGAVDWKTLASKLPRLRKLHVERNPVETTATLVEDVRAAFPHLLTLNGEALVLCEALNLEVAAPTRASVVGESTVDRSSPLQLAAAGFTLPPFDVDKFTADTTARLEQLLHDAKQTLEVESVRVEEAFRLVDA